MACCETSGGTVVAAYLVTRCYALRRATRGISGGTPIVTTTLTSIRKSAHRPKYTFALTREMKRDRIAIDPGTQQIQQSRQIIASGRGTGGAAIEAELGTLYMAIAA